MATSRRIERVAPMIKREVSLMLLNGIKDDRVGAGMVSVTDVIVRETFSIQKFLSASTVVMRRRPRLWRV